jgi:hypothetical protein
MGVLNSAIGVDLRFHGGPLVFVDEAEDGSALDPLLGETGGGVAGSRRVQPTAAVGSASVVVASYSVRIARRCH